MSTAWSTLGLACSVALMVGCTQETLAEQAGELGEQTGQTSAPVLGAEELTVLAFVNDQQAATEAVLDDDCGIRSDSARHIVEHRDGHDQTPGTADDDLFDSVEELDGVSMVGDWTLEQLTVCAESHGYAPTAAEFALLNFLNDYPNTTFERLDDDCGLRSDAAGNLIAHRDGPDGVPGTQDDDPFHGEAEVDAVAQVGPATLGQLQACAESFCYNIAGTAWCPIPIEAILSSEHPDLLVWQSDGIIYMDNSNAPKDYHVHIEFDGHVFGIKNGYGGMWTHHLSNSAPDGYGAEDIGVDSGLTRVMVTKDPPGTLTTAQALDAAREGLVTYMRDVRIHEEDWAEACPSFTTWEAAVGEGMLDHINAFGDPGSPYFSSFSDGRTMTEYEFTGRGPFLLDTRINISKATGEVTYVRVILD
ncbi:MAG: hypothetical protein JRI68_25075 [Deltaproteobacteria bacterium]|nr:hypothetical protein [Deltaproteobacteria bacterium]